MASGVGSWFCVKCSQLIDIVDVPRSVQFAKEKVSVEESAGLVRLTLNLNRSVDCCPFYVLVAYEKETTTGKSYEF